MESVIVAIALLALVLAAGGLLLKQRAQAERSLRPWAAPVRSRQEPDDAPRLGGARHGAVGPGAAGAITPPGALSAAVPSRSGPMEIERRPIIATERTTSAESNDEPLVARLDALDRRLDTLARAVDRQNADIGAALRELRVVLEARGAADEATRERLRADLLAAATRMPSRSANVAANRRDEACADLYAHLARLEWSLAAVANPVLLPGEPFAPSTELLPAALAWENWNDVGERAFALGETFSARRLHLSPPARQEFERFVTSLRTLLTRSIYPNAQPGASPDQQATVRVALEEIAVALPRMRETLEAELREEGA